MNQVLSGRFIASLRKEAKLTQSELAEKLNISDKTVSKWECGGGMPELSLMLPLCEILGITVNELLSGERLSIAAYQKKAEENIMSLLEENQENKKKFTVSMIMGVTCVIAVVALVMLAAFLEIPTAARIAFIVLAVGVMVAGIGAAAVMDREAGTFECPHCGEHFVPTMKEYVKGYHTFTKRQLTCPKCGERGMCKHVITRKG